MVYTPHTAEERRQMLEAIGVAEHTYVVQDDHECADSHQAKHDADIQRRRIGLDLLLRRCGMVRRVLFPASFGSCHGRHINPFSMSESL